MRKTGKERNKKPSIKMTVETEKKRGNILGLLIIATILIVAAIAGSWYLLQPKSQSGFSPVAVFTHSPDVPLVNETVTFDASASTQGDGHIVSYFWDFGDGSPAVNVTDPTTTHIYTIEGNYTVVLAVTDIGGLSDTEIKSIMVLSPSTYPIMPSSWEEFDNSGSYQNPIYAYDGNAATHADIDSPGRWEGDGAQTLSESIVYTFQLGSEVTEGTLYYTWKTSVYIECVTCRGKAKIFYWNFETSTWDQIGSWEGQSQSTRKLNVPPEHISSNGTFKVKFLAESAWEGPYWSGTEIDLYETYVGVGD